MSGKYIDIHCHPSLFPFNRMRNTKKEDTEEYNLWHSDPPSEWEKGKIIRYSQSDFPTLIQGDFKVICASLTPIEREFLLGQEEGNKLEKKGVLNEFRDEIIHGDNAVRVVGCSLVSSFPISRVKFLQSNEYDYFKELNRNYDFYLKDNDKVFKFKPIDNDKNLNRDLLQGKYILTKNFSDIERVLNHKLKGVGQIAVVFTIEGGHIFSKNSRGKDRTIKKMLNRIDYIKTNWKYPVLFVSPAHHFYNGLCGHARSIPYNLRWIADQDVGMGGEITKLGMTAIKRFLSIDGSRGRRILIDIKHMSPEARKQYYYDIVIPYNQENEEKKIPIVASHVAYSGVKSLDELVGISKSEIDSEVNGKDKFFPTSLNLCDEEIQMIAKSGGLFGLILNERLLASKERLDKIKDRKDPKEWAQIMFEQIEGCIRAVQSVAKSREEKREAWDCLAIGSDFDGFCNPPDTFYSAATIPLLEESLIEILKEYPEQKSLLAGLDVEEAVEKVMFENVFEFLRRNFH